MMECDKVKKICIPGRSFVHTGLSVAYGKWIEGKIGRRGGIVKTSVSGNTDYLIVDTSYKQGDKTETTKYAKALDLRASGKNEKLVIIDVNDFEDACDNGGVCVKVEEEFRVDGIAQTPVEKPKKAAPECKEGSPVSTEDFNECKKYIKNLKKPVYDMRLKEIASDGVKHTCIGGTAYWPLSMIDKYPVDQDGDPLALLAQINFDDIKTRYDDPFPEHGMLQIFGSFLGDQFMDDAWVSECGPEMSPDIKVIYWDEVDYSLDLKDLLSPEDYKGLPMETDMFRKANAYGITFVSSQKSLPKEYDYNEDVRDFIKERCNIDLGEKACDELKKITGLKTTGWLTHELLDEWTYDDEPRIGGFSSVLNHEYNECKSDINLFTLESVGRVGDFSICVGDVGFINFRIKLSDLLNKNFNKLMIYSDMG